MKPNREQIETIEDILGSATKYRETYEELYDFMHEELAAQAPGNTQVVLVLGDCYQMPDDTDHKQVTFRIVITNPNRTLTDKEVAAVLDAVSGAAKTKLKAARV